MKPHDILVSAAVPTYGIVKVEAETPQKALAIARKSFRKHGMDSPLMDNTNVLYWKSEFYLTPTQFIGCRLP